MEGIQTIQALKAVQSSLPAQTTIPSDELVMLYAADGTPIAKIARDDLVKAVASVMASNSQTTFSKLLGVQANGTPMGIGASDLASVLGGVVTYSYNLIGNTETKCFMDSGVFILWLANESLNSLVFIVSNDAVTKLNTPWYSSQITITQKEDHYVYITYNSSIKVSIRKLI